MIKQIASLVFVFVFFSAARAEAMENQQIKISEINYFGYESLDLPKIKAALPLHVDDEFGNYLKYHQACLFIKKAVKELTGKESTDEALIFYDKRYVVYIGLPGRSNQAISLLPSPTGSQVVSADLHAVYDESMQANERQLRSRDQRDKDAWEELRIKAKGLALKDADGLSTALRESANPKERLVAAYGLGLIAEDKSQLAALVAAGADSDHVVRNNAIRALGVILGKQPELAPLIPCGLFIALVNSPDWTDRNKAVFVLLGLTRSRSPVVLQKMRQACLPSLIEMTLWPKGYSDSALTLLGRIADMSDEKIHSVIERQAASEIVTAAQAKIP